MVFGYEKYIFNKILSEHTVPIKYFSEEKRFQANMYTVQDKYK